MTNEQENNPEDYSPGDYPEEPRREARDALPSSPIERFGSHVTTLTNPKSALFDFEMLLKNMRYEDGEYIFIGGDKWRPMLNEQGCNACLMAMQNILNKNTSLSNLDDWEISILIRHL